MRHLFLVGLMSLLCCGDIAAAVFGLMNALRLQVLVFFVSVLLFFYFAHRCKHSGDVRIFF